MLTSPFPSQTGGSLCFLPLSFSCSPIQEWPEITLNRIVYVLGCILWWGQVTTSFSPVSVGLGLSFADCPEQKEPQGWTVAMGCCGPSGWAEAGGRAPALDAGPQPWRPDSPLLSPPHPISTHKWSLCQASEGHCC